MQKMHKLPEVPPSFEMVMRSLLKHHADRLISLVPRHQCTVCTATQTNGELPVRIFMERDLVDVRGVTGSRSTANKARKVIGSARCLVAAQHTSSRSHIYHTSLSKYAQAHPDCHDVIYYIPRIPALFSRNEVYAERCRIHNLVCRCVGALKVGGVLVVVLVNPYTHLTFDFRNTLAHCVKRACDFAGASFQEERVLDLPDLDVPEGRSDEQIRVARSCLLLVAHGKEGRLQ